VALFVLLAVCARLFWREQVPVPSVRALESPAAAVADVTHGQRVRWVLLSLAPTSLLLGVTSYITTDVAAVPLFWVVPLALYLLTFILVFAQRLRGHARGRRRVCAHPCKCPAVDVDGDALAGILSHRAGVPW
jgi:hypothetical protein